MGSKVGGICLMLLTFVALTSCASANGGTVKEEGVQPAGAASDQETAPTLRQMAEKRGFYVGAAVNYDPFSKDAAYRQAVAEHFNMLTPENDMKFMRLHPEKDRYTFDNADKLMAFAAEHRITVRGHTLVWHRSLPKWVEEGQWDKEQLKAVLKEHIQTVVSRYKGKIAVWDVVNEAFNDDGSYRDNIWHKVIGPEYIELAFRWAHEADPDALLYYNDYTNEGMSVKSNRIYEMARDFRSRQVPIHGIGWQMHVRTMNYASPDKMKQNLQRLGALGLQVQITEMDVKVNDNKDNTPDDKMKRQADVYAGTLAACLKEANCTAFVTWGVGDKYTYLKEQDPKERPLLLDEQFRPKPAYQAVTDVLKR
ncbi:Endo-1,4-beta-xylanase Z [Paenibacillus solanacearum]|uniref:endo-1,4-beta-xylanase n=1 Tax=Paenibacillus solanacearum TaxID=2048548 RepID=A0A916K8K5_9BACL|nr:endo-1,4-beta-xylanase [Paenibacillus solanacearum]CAG7645124.1 Endo-1,4-beta-xylanase Z [Paenibacillus solanacearum]